MSCTDFPSAGLIPNVTTHTVGNITYIWTGIAWESQVNVPAGELVNDLSQAYIFNTVAEYQASTIVFPVGKTVYLNDRQADFTVIAGTTSSDGVIVSTEVNQSIELLDDIGLVNMGCVLDGVTDDTVAFMEACSLSRSRGVPIRETQVGILKYSTTADFTANGAGLIWAGVSKCKLLYGGVAGTNAVQVDNGGAHRIASTSSQTGNFLYGEVVVGQITGRHSVVRQRHIGAPLELQATSDGGVVDGEDIDGLTSGATARTTTLVDVDYGSSLQDIKLKGFTIRADRTQLFDGFSRPLDWAESTALYLNSFRNGCEVKDVRPEGFRYGHYSKFNWLANIRNCKAHTCWAGHTLDGEFNSAIFDQNSSNRFGAVADFSGWGLLFTTSYGTTNKAFDMETGNGSGIIYENLRGCSHSVGDIEGNDNSVWKIKVRGLIGSPFDSASRQDFTQGFTIDGARIYKDLGIEFNDGVYGCAVRGSRWSNGTDAPTSGTFIARVVANDLATVKNILFEDSNSYYGDNDNWQPAIALIHRSTEWLDNERAKYFNVLSQPLDITNGNGVPVASLPTGAIITQVDYMADNSDIPTTAGSFELDLGLDASIGAFYTDDVVTVPNGGTTDTYLAPYGLYGSKTAGISESSAGGVVRARIQVNSAGTGKIILRIWYKIKF